MSNPKQLFAFLSSGLMILSLAATSFAQVEFFGSAKIQPSFFSNFDFNDNTNDVPTLVEGGFVSGEFIRAEVRLGWKAGGDDWSVKMIAESDMILTKDNADRSYYAGAEKNGQPVAGGEFGIERAEFTYAFNPALQLEAGWDIRYLDLLTGGLLYGDDHPFVGFRGTLPTESLPLSYELLYMPIQNQPELASTHWKSNDWRVYTGKLSAKFGSDKQYTLAPLAVYSDNQQLGSKVTYLGLEGMGIIDMFKPTFEVIYANGSVENSTADKDVSALAMFAGLEAAVSKSFNPYVAVRYASGDDDANDDDISAFVGITDIARFSPVIGMDGNVLGSHITSYGASFYAYTPERAPLEAGLPGDNYGGLSGGGKGNHPGQILLAFGAKGDLSNLLEGLSYKAQSFLIWYDETDNLPNKKDPGEEVDDYAGTTFDLQLKYKLNKNFSIDYIGSVFVPGEGLEQTLDADDNAQAHILTLAWSY